MKKKSIKNLALNKEVISSFNRMVVQGGGANSHNLGCGTGQSFCGYATCGPGCEVQTASLQTVCCN